LIRETGFEAFLVNRGCGPLEWAGGLVVGFDESVDVGLEFVERIERGTSERFASEDRKASDNDAQFSGISRKFPA
jgi:hypothetical protein